MAYLLLLLSLATPVFAADVWTGPPVVMTTGQAVLHVAPDRVFVTFATEGRDAAAKPAQQQEARATTALRKTLAEAGIKDEAVRTLAYDLQQEFDYPGGKQTPRGFVARQTLEVRLDDVNALGDLLGRAVASGAAAVSGVRFDVKAREQLERDALKNAVEDARARATAAAAGAGATVSGLIRIEEQRTFEGPRPVAMARGMVAEAAAVASPVAPGEIEIRSTVSLTSSLR